MAPSAMNMTKEQKEQQDIDDWLPITSSRKAKWWYSAFHNVTALVGAGVLSLPYAMSELGWGPGVAAMILSWVIILYTLWQMVEMHECVPVQMHPSSVLFLTKPDCVIFNELVRTTQNYVKNLSRIDPLWLAELAPQYYATED